MASGDSRQYTTSQLACVALCRNGGCWSTTIVVEGPSEHLCKCQAAVAVRHTKIYQTQAGTWLLCRLDGLHEQTALHVLFVGIQDDRDRPCLGHWQRVQEQCDIHRRGPNLLTFVLTSAASSGHRVEKPKTSVIVVG